MNAVRIQSATKALPNFFRETKDIIPLVEFWLSEQDQRFRRKVIKIFEGAGVDRRYSIMEPEEVFTATSFEEKNAIYCREVKKTRYRSIKKQFSQGFLVCRFFRLHYHGKLHWNYDSLFRCLFN